MCDFYGSPSDPSLSSPDCQKSTKINSLYVYDLLLAWSDHYNIISFKTDLGKKSYMKHLREAYMSLGLRIYHNGSMKTLDVSQTDYVDCIISRFNTTNGSSSPTSMLSKSPQLAFIYLYFSTVTI